MYLNLRKEAATISGFRHDEAGQDLIEYTLMLAFVALVAVGLFIQAGTVTAGIWSTTNKVLSTANKAAS